jgi:hypothetical protein
MHCTESLLATCAAAAVARVLTCIAACCTASAVINGACSHTGKSKVDCGTAAAAHCTGRTVRCTVKVDAGVTAAAALVHVAALHESCIATRVHTDASAAAAVDLWSQRCADVDGAVRCRHCQRRHAEREGRGRRVHAAALNGLHEALFFAVAHGCCVRTCFQRKLTVLLGPGRIGYELLSGNECALVLKCSAWDVRACDLLATKTQT